MAAAPERRRVRRGAIAAVVASIAVVGVVVTLAVTSSGYESQEVPRLESTVWVTRDDGRYGRVNADLAELDTVRSITDPSTVAQAGAVGVVFSGGLRERWAIDPAQPDDLIEASGGAAGAADSDTTGTDVATSASTSSSSDDGPVAEPTPEGTREVVSSGDYVAYRTDTGRVSLGTLGAANVTTIDPFAAEAAGGAADGGDGDSGDEPDQAYSASAVAVDDRGRLAAYSASEGAVRVYDSEAGDFVGGATTLADPPAADARVLLALVGGRWILVEAGAGRAWAEGDTEPFEVAVDADAVLQQSSATGGPVLVADGTGLLEIDPAARTAERVADATGTPAQPVRLSGDEVAAWLSDSGGTLWSRSGGAQPLEVPDDVLKQATAITPVLRTNGDRAVLNETATGLLWTAPDGRAIPLAQWAVDDEEDREQGTIQVDDVAEQKPPVAVGDEFGVRSGQLVRLPVLLNDHDPNRSDVLTVAAGSVGALSDPGFGEVTVVGDSQTLAVRVTAESGSATFQYAVSDGAAASAPATVTLTVVDPAQNTAAEWCGVSECRQVWPSPQVLPGGTAIVPVLEAWVDPEGDAFVLSDAHAAEPGAPVTVVPRADGRVAIRHTDPNADDARIPVVVTVTDANGAVAEKTLDLVVSASSSLQAASIAVTGGAGETVTVKVADHVTGGSGAFRLLDAVDSAGGASGLVVTPNAAANEIELSATEPGEHAVSYTVADSVSQAEQSATIRYTVVDRATPLAIAPLTAFVRPGEDTTLDVLSAVQNATGRVLLLSDATSNNGNLNVGIVGASQLRLAIAGGVVAADAPALVGRARVTVADGTGAAVFGDVSVFLAADTGGDAPIALPDSVTVRAGTLADIDVLGNDVSPRGARLVLDHRVVGSDTEGELAFASADALRYVAPTTAGTYRLTYAVALESDPTRVDQATVTVTVLPTGVNRAPRPAALNARVLSGQSISIDVPAYGVDPDGDRVVLDGVGQPPAGSGAATIGADGDTIVYHAPGAGIPGGQLSFEYTVRDPDGEVGTGVVRVGVLDADLADAAPVTFSDYVRTTRGAPTPVTVAPLSNDRDPALGDLELVAIEPNVPTTSPEYDRLAGLVDASTSLEEGRAVIRAGDVAGTNSYLYTVRSTTTSSTAQGLIVVNVGELASADHLVVADTVVTARNRGEFESSGLDVVTGKVEWATGDVSSLQLELWGSGADRYDVDGWRISGKLPSTGDLVPFRLATADGDVATYGVLRIPAFDDLPVQLSPDADTVEVAEEKTVGFDVRDLLDLASGDRVQLGEGPYTVQRQNSACRPTGAGKAEYQAGREAPWTDTCLLTVRLQGQSRWSALAVPIDVQPKDPQAQLGAISRTVAPGATESIQLYDAMTTWEGGRTGDRAALDYHVSFSGSSFLMRASGDQVAFEARADAVPGTREAATVSVSAFGGVSATITLVVGVAPPDAPRGATFTRECTVSAGSCTIPVVGLGGEYDPFSGKTGAGLSLVSIGSGGGVRCDVASVSMSGTTAVTATFPSGQTAFGGTCVVPFTVRDAQNRTGQGTLTIDVQGFPQRPASISTVAYSANGVTLEVVLGEAARAHPPVTAVRIYRDGRDQGADCTNALSGVYRCVVTGLSNGARTNFTARAVNSVGESLDTSAVTTWAYQSPGIGRVTAIPVYERNRTTTSNAVVELQIESSDDTRQLRIEQVWKTIDRTGPVTTVRLDLRPGSQLLTVVPISVYEPPIAGSSDGASANVAVSAAGAPRFTSSIQAGATSNTSIQVSDSGVDGNGSAQPTDVSYIAWARGQSPRCEVDSGGGNLTVSGNSNAVVTASAALTGLEDFEWYEVKACATNGFGVAESNTVRVLTYTTAAPPTGTTTYSVATSAARDGTTAVYRYPLVSAPSVTSPSSKFHIEYFLYGSWQQSFSLSTGQAPGDVRVRACRWVNTNCTAETAVTWSGAPTIVDVSFPTQCVETVTRDVVIVSQAAAGSFTADGVVAADGLTATATVRFSGQYAGLAPVSHVVDICQPDPPTDPPTEPPTDPPTDPPTAPPTGTGTTP